MAKNLEIAVLLDLYGDMLTEKQRDFLGYYYNDDLSLSEIAENEGITRQGVRDAIKRAEAQLFDITEPHALLRQIFLSPRQWAVTRKNCPVLRCRNPFARLRTQSTRPHARNPAPCPEQFFSVLDCAM